MKERDKDRLRIIEMSLVLDEQGKVRITQDLMDALHVQPGDMLAFSFDREKESATVKGMKKPPYVHSDIQVRLPLLKSDPQSLSSPTPSPEVTQMPLFEPGQTKPPPTQRRRTR